MVIGTNISAQNDALLLQNSSNQLQLSLQRLSSGSKIISPADDAAGLGEVMRLTGQTYRDQAASDNMSNALSFQQTQDGYLANVTNALDRMSELAIQAQDVTKSDSDRTLYNQEYQTLSSYVANVQNQDFNGVSLFSGNALNVTDDESGHKFALTGISANYLSASTTTTTQGYSANTLLSQVVPAFAGNNPGDGLTPENLSSPGPSTEVNFTPNTATISDLVNFFNSSFGAGSASYSSSTGQLSLTIPSNEQIADDYGSPLGSPFGGSTTQGLLAELGMTNGGGLFSDTYVPSQTFTTTFSHQVTTTTTGAGDISTISDASSALSSIKSAISAVASDRANIGAGMQRLQYNISQLGTLDNNLSAANSRISDVDIAQESTVYARENILVQTGTAMLAQANSQPMSVLKLLG